MEDTLAAGAEATITIGEKERVSDFRMISPEIKNGSEVRGKYPK